MLRDGVHFRLLLVGGRQEAGKQNRGGILKTKPRSIFFLVHSSYVEKNSKREKLEVKS
jgi:hypothetical protein